MIDFLVTFVSLCAFMGILVGSSLLALTGPHWWLRTLWWLRGERQVLHTYGSLDRIGWTRDLFVGQVTQGWTITHLCGPECAWGRPAPELRAMTDGRIPTADLREIYNRRAW